MICSRIKSYKGLVPGYNLVSRNQEICSVYIINDFTLNIFLRSFRNSINLKLFNSLPPFVEDAKNTKQEIISKAAIKLFIFSNQEIFESFDVSLSWPLCLQILCRPPEYLWLYLEFRILLVVRPILLFSSWPINVNITVCSTPSLECRTLLVCELVCKTLSHFKLTSLYPSGAFSALICQVLSISSFPTCLSYRWNWWNYSILSSSFGNGHFRSFHYSIGLQFTLMDTSFIFRWSLRTLENKGLSVQERCSWICYVLVSTLRPKSVRLQGVILDARNTRWFYLSSCSLDLSHRNTVARRVLIGYRKKCIFICGLRIVLPTTKWTIYLYSTYCTNICMNSIYRMDDPPISQVQCPGAVPYSPL